MVACDETSRVRIAVFNGGHDGGYFALFQWPDLPSEPDEQKYPEVFSVTTKIQFRVSGTDAFGSAEYKEIESEAKAEARRRGIEFVTNLDG